MSLGVSGGGVRGLAAGLGLSLAVGAPAYAEAPSFLHVNHGLSGFSTFIVTPGGALMPISQPPFPTSGRSVVLEPFGRSVYVEGVVTPGTVRQYRIIGSQDGRPDPLWSEFPTGAGTAEHLSVHPSGRFLYSSHANGGAIAGLAINEPNLALSALPGSPYALSASSAGSLVEPRGRFLYVAHSTTFEVTAFRIDPVTGALRPVAGSPFRVGAPNGGLAADPRGRFLYVTSQATSSIHAFSIDSVSGTLTPVLGSPFGAQGNPQQATVDPSGRFLYVSNDQDSVAGFAINSSGSLSPVPGSPFPAGLRPRAILTDLRGRFVFVANRDSDDISAYAIQAQTGALSPIAGSPFASGGNEPWGLTHGRNLTRGDVQADGQADLLWRHEGSGEDVVWFMNGTTLISGTFTVPRTLADTNWTIGGTHDFDGDRQTDILWRHRVSGENVVWYMDGHTLTTGTYLSPATLEPVWAQRGTGDFDGDGRTDIVWQHGTTGQVVVWFMEGNVRWSESVIYQSPFHPPDWKVAGVADFNLDRLPDLFWRNQSSGEMLVWFWTGAALGAAVNTNPPALADGAWEISALGDYNHDGHQDLVWRHAGSGQNVVWLMIGTNLARGESPPTVADTRWKIVGPR